MFSFKRLKQSFADAFNGFSLVFKNEQNFRIQVVLAICTLVIIFVLPLRSWEAVLMLCLIVMVLSMELLNTAIERFIDLLKPRLHHYAGAIKDIMAAAVLVTSLGALIIGTIIVLPHFLNLIK